MENAALSVPEIFKLNIDTILLNERSKDITYLSLTEYIK